MAVSSTKWGFNCAGMFAGTTSFKDDEDFSRYYLKVEYFGGKFAVEISERDYKRITETKRLGCDCRLGGLIFLNGGNPKPVLQELSFEGEKGFSPIDLQEQVQGMICQGFAQLSYKRQWEREDGTTGCSCTLAANGGLLRGVSVDPNCFSSLPDGPAIVSASVMTEISQSFTEGSRRTVVKNSLTVKGAKSI